MRFVIALALALQFLSTSPLKACDQSFFGGPIENWHERAKIAFDEAVGMAWKTGKITIEDRFSLRLVVTDDHLAGMPIFYRDNTISYTEGFLRAVVHTAVAQQFVYARDTGFDMGREQTLYKLALAEAVSRNLAMPYFHDYIGMEWDDCATILNHQASWQNAFYKEIRASLHFWFLHEIAHHALEHRPPNVLTQSEAHIQEYAADDWAISTLAEIFDGQYFLVPEHRRFHEAFTIFLNAAIYESHSHPALSCRVLRTLMSIREFAGDGEHVTLPLDAGYYHTQLESIDASIEIQRGFMDNVGADCTRS